MVHFTALTVATFFASMAIAVPSPSHQHRHSHQHLHEKRQSTTFSITVHNNCGWTKSAGLFQISSTFEMISMSSPVSMSPGDWASFNAPYDAIGMRLSGTADEGTTAQWNPQALFEFGYSSDGSLEGTAYNLSLMDGSDDSTGIAVSPDNGACESKSCSPSDCPADQGWTSPTQDTEGSPADTTCYYGPTNFVVTFCP